MRLKVHRTRLTAANARALVAGHDVVVDGTDNFAARYAVNDACAALGVPNVYGSVHRWEGQVGVFAAPDPRAPGGRGPCYRCLYPAPPADGLVPNCAEAGVLGALPGVVGALQATEALKLLLGAGDALGLVRQVDLGGNAGFARGALEGFGGRAQVARAVVDDCNAHLSVLP